MRRPIPLLVLLVLVGCGSDRQAQTETRREKALAKSPLPAVPPANPLSPYESPGQLAPGAEPVLGVVVPRIGRVLSQNDDMATVLVPSVPYEAARAFFARRLETGRVEPASQGTRFLGARPRPPGNARRRVDVVLRATPRGTVASIFDKTPTGRPAPPGGDEAVRALQRKQMADR